MTSEKFLNQHSVTQMVVTPEIAKSWLESNASLQRKLNPKVVDEYALAMRKGQWVLTHQGIALDSNGFVIDGQHRLGAIVKSGVAVEMQVTFNASAASFSAIDRGYNRSSVQIARIAGVECSQWTVSACNSLLWKVDSPRSSMRTWSVADLPDVLSFFRDEIDFCFPQKFSGSQQFRNGTIRGAILRALISKPSQSGRIAEFIECIATGRVIRGTEDNAAMTLVNRLRNSSSLKMKDRESRYNAYGVTLSALRHFLDGTDVKYHYNLVPPVGRQPFPALIDDYQDYETFSGYLARKQVKAS